MRDIRGDLQERAHLLEQQINAEHAQFEKLIQQLTTEQESRVEELKTELEAVNRVKDIEHRRLGSATSAPQPQSQQSRAQQQPQLPNANFAPTVTDISRLRRAV
jgi:predicted RNase H-like nuclease (RuvC/YqgF family)